MNDKEIIDTCIAQSTLGASRWDRRRSEEWKMTFSFWLAILALGKIVADGPWRGDTLSSRLLGVAGVAVVLWAYGFIWLRNLWAANDSDKAWEFHFRKEAFEKLHDPSHKIEKYPDKTKPSRLAFKDWSIRFQFLLTLFLLAAVFLLWAFGTPSSVAPHAIVSPFDPLL